MGAPETQEPTPGNSTSEGTEVVRRIDAVLEALTSFRESQDQFNQEALERFDRQDQFNTEARERFDRQEQFNQEARERFDRQEQFNQEARERFDRQEQFNQEARERFDRQDQFNQEARERSDRADLHFEKMDRDLGYLRGYHAISAAERNASLIADDMGYQLVDLVPRETLIGLANMARDAGKPEDQVRSFREADLVMLAREYQGQPVYIAVEASFTVASNDINRAKRNAEYMHEFTGLSAKGAVAGVEITSGREQNANADGVHCYRIPVRQLQAD